MFNYAETLYELATARQRELIMEAERRRRIRRTAGTLAECGSRGTARAR